MSIQIESCFDFPECLLWKYKPLDLIGAGAYGEVWKALHLQSNNLVAVKVFKSLFNDCVDSKRILREIYLLKRIRHPNVIQVLDICVENLNNFRSVYLVLEYMPYNLSQSIAILKNVNVKVIFKIIYQLLNVLSYLKRKNVMHRDIKPCNILIDESFNVKVCDFGISRNIDRKRKKSLDHLNNLSATSFKELRENRLSDITNLPSIFFSISKFNDNTNKKRAHPLTHQVGSRWYRAPELILLNNSYDEKIDIWALGCVIAEMMG
jgi:mitogen-activated protein kinase 1/3